MRVFNAAGGYNDSRTRLPPRLEIAIRFLVGLGAPFVKCAEGIVLHAMPSLGQNHALIAIS